MQDAQNSKKIQNVLIYTKLRTLQQIFGMHNCNFLFYYSLNI